MGSELLRIAEGFSIVAEGLRGLAKAEGGTKDKTVKAQPSVTEKAQKQDAAQESPATLEGIRALMAQKTQEEEADNNEVLVENAHSETAAFALLFEFDGDIRKIRHVLYNCSASRPKIEGKTNEESREVQTETLTIKARPLASGYVKAKTGNKTSAETYANWYKSVYLPEPKAVDAETEGQG